MESLFAVGDGIRRRFTDWTSSKAIRGFHYFLVRLFMHPCYSRQLAPFGVPNLIFDPDILDAFVGLSLEINNSSRWLALKLIFDPFTLLGHLTEELVVGTRG